VKGPKVEVPDINIKGPKIKSPKIPKAEIDIHGPEVDLNMKGAKFDGDLDLDAPDIKGGIKGFFKGMGGKIKTPDIQVPELNLQGPSIDIPDLSIDTNLPNLDVDIKSPKIKSPKIDIKSPSLDLDIKGPKVKIPKGDIKGPSLDLDISLPSVDVDIKSPKVKVPKVEKPDLSIKGPKIKIPKVDLPDVDFQTPTVDLDLNAPDIKGGIKGFFKGMGGKIKTPDIKVPDLNLRGPSIDIPDLSIDTDLPKVEIDISSPKIKSPKVDIKGPSLDLDIKGPKVKVPKADTKGPSLDLDIKGPKVKVPKADIKGPSLDLDINVPSVDVDIKSPKVKLPKFEKTDINLKGPSFEKPDIDLNIKAPKFDGTQLDLDAPDIKGGIKGFFKGMGGKIRTQDIQFPDLKLKGPNVDLPDINVDTDIDYDLSGSKIKSPKVDVDIKSPKVKIPKADIKGPSFDLDIKGPKIKTPKADISVKTPEIDVDLPDTDFSSSEIKGGVKGFIKGVGGKIKTPEVQTPSVNLKTDISDINFESNFDNNLDLHGTSHGFSDVEIKTPKIKPPKVDFNAPPFDLDIKVPSIKGPSFKISEINQDTKSSTLDNVNFSHNADIDFCSKLSFKQGELFYGVDMPMTIVNHDFVWSHENAAQTSEDRILQRSFVDTAQFMAAQQIFYPFGNHNIINQAINNSARSHVEYELKTAKIRKDPLISVNNSNNNNNNNIPGDINFQVDASVRTRDSSESNIKTKSNTGSFFRRKLSSASSVSNIAVKKTVPTQKSQLISRSESADPSSRRKVDYSIPRKCVVLTRPDFDGLGIHIACDKKTRLSPYIHEVEPDSPGAKAGLRKNDYILEINGEDAVFMEFTHLIKEIQNFIKENNLCITVGNEKAHKKWVRNHQNTLAKKSSSKEVKSKK
jgi:hypothetical protein